MSVPRTTRALHRCFESVDGSLAVVQVYRSLSVLRGLWEYFMASGCLNFMGGWFEWFRSGQALIRDERSIAYEKGQIRDL